MPDGANKGSFVQGYNAQIAVDSASQVIVAAEVTQETNDKKQLLPMIAQIEKNLANKAGEGQRRHGLLQRGECDR
jgi:hypothetical protein